MHHLKCFKAYDIRGKVPEELNEELVYKIGISYAQETGAKKVIVGFDGRLESPMLFDALVKGLNSQQVTVINIGLCGTEEVYFHTFHQQHAGVDGGIMITASHNPMGYNGLKMVGVGAKPLSLEDDLQKIHDRVIHLLDTLPTDTLPKYISQWDKSEYIHHLLSYIKNDRLKPLRIVVNPGHGTAGIVIEELAKHLPIEFIMIHGNVDGTFPKGVPNPMLIENQQINGDAVINHKADFGIAWDGDFDRCFFFDEIGQFIEGYYIVGLLAQVFLEQYPNAGVIHDPKLIWNTQEIVQQYGGHAIQCQTGHSFFKKMMRNYNAVYGGEISAHHYFRDFGYCDSGMIPWLLIATLVCEKNMKLSQLVDRCIKDYPCSGERNYHIDQVKHVLDRVYQYYLSQHPIIDQTDGLSMSFDEWRFNIRSSNTEPLLRLNLETKAKPHLIAEKVLELENLFYEKGK